ncbi:hypothetical protein BY996DRAFT_6486108 [Phakopsora pachyrhizi]|nr:hypothetical protein BY996DRAFT_6486108 [Phakopsora pachyrhizi]
MAEPKSYGRDGEGLEPINETTHEDWNDFDTTARSTGDGHIDYEGGFLKTITDEEIRMMSFNASRKDRRRTKTGYGVEESKGKRANDITNQQTIEMSYEGASERRDRMSRLTTLTLEIEGRRVDGGLRMSRSRGRRMNRGRWVVQHKTGKEEQSDSDERRGTPRSNKAEKLVDTDSTSKIQPNRELTHSSPFKNQTDQPQKESSPELTDKVR